MLRLHNRYLPAWAHRIANGVMAFLGLASVGSIGTSNLASDSFLGKACLALLYISPAGLLASLADPTRFTLVEGVAGDLGYDELVKGVAGEDGDGELV